MRVRFHTDAAALLAAAEPFFRSDPFSANVIAVVAARAAEGTQPDGGDALWLTVEDAGASVIGVAMRTPPYFLFLSRMPSQAAAALATAVFDVDRELPGVTGACESTGAFADAWCELTAGRSTRITAMRMYRLEQLQPPAAPGTGRPAVAPGDVELVADWLAAFHREAQPRPPNLDWPLIAEQRVSAGEIHLWCDADTPVSLAAVSAPAAGVARVGPVYTPAQWRRQGYGAAVTAAATAAAIAAGAEHVVLYTDLANPTSNSIYQAIGFRPEHDAEERLLG